MRQLMRHIVSGFLAKLEGKGLCAPVLLVLLTLGMSPLSGHAQEADSVATRQHDTVAVTLDTIGWTQTVAEPRTLYDLPYSTTRRMHDWHRLARNTTAFTLAGVATLYILETLPEDATALNKKELRRM